MATDDPKYTTHIPGSLQGAVIGDNNTVNINYFNSSVPGQPNLSDILYSRPEYMKIFVSSRMSGGVLDAERQAVIAAIDKTGMAHAWAWERDAIPGTSSAEDICMGHAKTSDCFVLILGEDISDIVRKEYKAAHEAKVECFILVKEELALNIQVTRFLKREKIHSTIMRFRNLSELQTQVTRALFNYMIQATRRHQLARQLQGYEQRQRT